MFGGGGFGAGGMPNPTPDEIRAIENDPFVRQFMEQAMQDPEVLRPMMQVSPTPRQYVTYPIA